MERRPLAVLIASSAFLCALAFASAQGVDLPNVSYKASEVIRLWPSTPPGESGALPDEHIFEGRPRPFDQVADVSEPTLSVFLPDAATRNGTAVLVIPGGGLERLAIEHEGYEVAQWLNEHGIAAFLLKYRVPPRDPEKRWKAGLQDAQRAMGIIRSRAAEWQLDPAAIGCIGFSAGGDIDVRLSTSFEVRQYSPVDAADAFSARPDFNVPVYGGGFADTAKGSLDDEVALGINKRTPPMFIVHAFDDQALSSIILMDALKRAGVPSELHIFGAGAHGFAVRESALPVNEWRALLLNWLAWQGYMDAADVRAYAWSFLAAKKANAPELARFGDAVATANWGTAFAAQRRVVRAQIDEGATVAGYKGGFTSDSSQASFGIDQLSHGVLFNGGRLEAAAKPVIKLVPGHPIMVETEIGYVIATDIATKIRLPRQAMTAVKALVPVIELPANLGAIMKGKASALDLTAVNIGSNQFIVGEAKDPASIPDLDALPISLRRDDEVLHEATGAQVKGGQAVNLMNLINQIVGEGRILHEGDIIICGSIPGAHPEAKGHYVADWGALGSIEFTLE